MSVRVYIVEDHPVMRETLQDYLALAPDLEICGMAESAEAASEALEPRRRTWLWWTGRCRAGTGWS